MAATAFETSKGYGNVCIWKGGNAKENPTCIDGRSTGGCFFLWSFGYDHKGDLVGQGNYGYNLNDEPLPSAICVILAGKSSLIRLSTKIFSTQPGATAWDGEYIVLTDQAAFAKYGGVQSGLRSVKLVGKNLEPVNADVLYEDDCYLSSTDIIDPFFFGKGNVTAASTKRATDVIAPNLFCYKAGNPAVDVWNYPAGGNPDRRYTSDLTDPYGAAISIAQ